MTHDELTTFNATVAPGGWITANGCPFIKMEPAPGEESWDYLNATNGKALHLSHLNVPGITLVKVAPGEIKW